MNKIKISMGDRIALAMLAITVAFAVGFMVYAVSTEIYGQFCAAGLVQGLFFIAAAIVMLMVVNYTRGCLAPIVAIGLAVIVALGGKVVVYALGMEPKASLNEAAQPPNFPNPKS